QCLSNSLESWYQQRTMAQKSQDIVSGLTDIGINIVVPDLIISKVATALGLMATNIKAVKEVEKASLFFQEEMSFLAVLESGVFLEKEVEAIAQFKAGESLIAAKQEAKIKYAVTELMEAEGKAARAAQGALQGLRPFEQVVAEVRELGGMIHFENVKLIEEVKEWIDLILHKINQPAGNLIFEKLGKIKTCYKGQPISVNVNLNHVLNCEYKIVKNAVNDCISIELQGGHMAGTCKALERAGVVKIKKVRMLSSGCEQYILENIMTGKVYTKTEFLTIWDAEKIVNSGLEILNDFTAIDEVAKVRGFVRAGVTSDGHKISIVFDQISEFEVDLITMWPR
ncbi:MAG: hypothetical protein NTU89_03950, partial [Candidatus Dependentiae bacterium]|nr:hypothetical protein [Candidatus Dependentiae bacterium]